MNNFRIKDMVIQAMIASIYFVLVKIFEPISFGNVGLIQFRIAEVMMIFALFNRKNVFGLTIGCLLSNLFASAPNPFDIIFGTFATTLAAVLMYQTRKNLVISFLWPAITNGIIVGFVLTYAYVAGPLYLSIPAVAIGEIGVLGLLGVPLYIAINKNPLIKEFLE